MFQKKKRIIAVAFGLTLTGALLQTPLLNAEESSPRMQESKLEAYIKFTQILNLIENQYVDEINTTTLIDKALKGLMGNLDAHSVYLDKKEYKDLTIQTQGEFGGLGIVVGMRNGALTVIAPIDDTPADRAGVKAGDIILKIDDKATLGMSIDDAVAVMRGKPKTPIVLTLIRKGITKPIRVKIIRDIIKIKSVKPKLVKLDDGTELLYLHISSFDSHVVEEVKSAIKSNPSAKGYIIDLRNNPGGLLDQAVGLLDMFIDKGVLVSQRGRNSEENVEYKAHKKDTDNQTPIVILVNGGSASASEIVSGAMQDDRRAIIIGEKTFGKGSVQIVIPLGKNENDGGLKLTVARYYLPSGRTIQNKGVTPDIVVYPGEVPRENNDSISIKEKDLKKHLEDELKKLDSENNVSTEGNTTIPNTSDDNNSTAEKKKKGAILDKKKIFSDMQLKSAIDILKVLILESETKRKK